MYFSEENVRSVSLYLNEAFSKKMSVVKYLPNLDKKQSMFETSTNVFPPCTKT